VCVRGGAVRVETFAGDTAMWLQIDARTSLANRVRWRGLQDCAPGTVRFLTKKVRLLGSAKKETMSAACMGKGHRAVAYPVRALHRRPAHLLSTKRRKQGVETRVHKKLHHHEYVQAGGATSYACCKSRAGGARDSGALPRLP
jgi:hypothetical protein